MTTQAIVMQRPSLHVVVSPTTVSALFVQRKELLEDERERARYPWAERFVMGFPLPSWQRGVVWTEEQQQRFIVSMWSDADLGTYLINNWNLRGGIYAPFSSILQDGQQRLTTLERYITDALAVPDVGGTPRLWSEVGAVERRRFGNKPFPRAVCQVWDEQQLREIYDQRNFAGTAHADAERAIPLPDDEEGGQRPGGSP